MKARAWFAAAALGWAQPVWAEVPDLIIVNARVFTADPSHPAAEAVAIDGTRIAFVGTSADAARLAGPDTRVIDAGGRLVTPGLIEAHGHAGPGIGGKSLPMPDLPWPGPSAEQTLAIVGAAAKESRDLLVGEVGPLVINDRRDWRIALDLAAPDTPVILRAWWGHGTLVNSRALALTGIEEGSPDPLGGWYGRTAAGRLDGRIGEGAEIMMTRRLTRTTSTADAAAAFDETAQLYSGWGVTSFHQMAHNLPLKATMEALSAARPVLKWSVYSWGVPQASVAEAWAEAEAAPASTALVRHAGIKFMLDGTPIERGARMRADYADLPGTRGRSNYSEALLGEILARGAAEPYQLALHVAGDGEVERLLATMEGLASPREWQERRLRIEHGDGLTPDLLARARNLGVVLVQNPLHLAPSLDEARGDMMTNRLGASSTGRFQLLASALKAGVPLAFGSDAGGSVASPFLNMMLAIGYQRNPDESLTREQALTAYTAGAAYAEGEEARKGRIAVGMAADLAILSQDLLTIPIEAFPATRSLLTVVDGEIVHEVPELKVE